MSITSIQTPTSPLIGVLSTASASDPSIEEVHHHVEDQVTPAQEEEVFDLFIYEIQKYLEKDLHPDTQLILHNSLMEFLYKKKTLPEGSKIRRDPFTNRHI